VHGHSAIGGVLARLAGGGGPVRVYTPNGITQLRAGLVVERALGRRTDVLIAVSRSEAELAEGLGIVPRERISVISNGIEPDVPPATGDLRTMLGIPSDTVVVGSVARLVRQKDPERFVAVAALVPEAHFLLVGTGPLQAAVARAVDAAGIGDRWHHVPLIPDVATLLGQLDLFVLTSRFEGAPYAALEAMRAGTPVVLTDVVGNRDVAAAGTVGILTPHGDVDAMAGAVRTLLADGPRRTRLAAAGQAHVREAHDVAEQGRAHAALYARLARTAER
jgi:glycosyltransferase involved in cell wall biosynthesis